MQFLGQNITRENMPSYMDPTTLKDHTYMAMQDDLQSALSIQMPAPAPLQQGMNTKESQSTVWS
jgi:hypothetical protein